MASAAQLAGNWTISTLAGSTPYCCRITLSKLTLAWVRPTTPMRCPASCAILVIFGPAFLPLALAGGGTPSTAPFFCRAARDPQGLRPHRKVIDTGGGADDGQKPRQRHEHHLPLRRTRRWRRLGPDQVEAACHRSGKQSFDAQFHIANAV